MQNYAYEATKGVHEADDLAKGYFSQENVERLHERIRFGVYRMSGGKHVIDKQSEEELIVIMRYFYLECGSFKKFMIQEEIEKLNKQVIAYCVPNIMNEIQSYMKYLDDSGKNNAPLEHAHNTNIKGSKSIEMKPFI